MIKKIEDQLERLLNQITHRRGSKALNFDDVGFVFYKIGVFTKLEFVWNEEENKAILELTN
jgi:hypothetical protein